MTSPARSPYYTSQANTTAPSSGSIAHSSQASPKTDQQVLSTLHDVGEIFVANYMARKEEVHIPIEINQGDNITEHEVRLLKSQIRVREKDKAALQRQIDVVQEKFLQKLTDAQQKHQQAIKQLQHAELGVKESQTALIENKEKRQQQQGRLSAERAQLDEATQHKQLAVAEHLNLTRQVDTLSQTVETTLQLETALETARFGADVVLGEIIKNAKLSKNIDQKLRQSLQSVHFHEKFSSEATKLIRKALIKNRASERIQKDFLANLEADLKQALQALDPMSLPFSTRLKHSSYMFCWGAVAAVVMLHIARESVFSEKPISEKIDQQFVPQYNREAQALVDDFARFGQQFSGLEMIAVSARDLINRVKALSEKFLERREWNANEYEQLELALQHWIPFYANRFFLDGQSPLSVPGLAPLKERLDSFSKSALELIGQLNRASRFTLPRIQTVHQVMQVGELLLMVSTIVAALSATFNVGYVPMRDSARIRKAIDLVSPHLDRFATDLSEQIPVPALRSQLNTASARVSEVSRSVELFKSGLADEHAPIATLLTSFESELSGARDVFAQRQGDMFNRIDTLDQAFEQVQRSYHEKFVLSKELESAVAGGEQQLTVRQEQASKYQVKLEKTLQLVDQYKSELETDEALLSLNHRMSHVNDALSVTAAEIEGLELLWAANRQALEGRLADLKTQIDTQEQTVNQAISAAQLDTAELFNLHILPKITRAALDMAMERHVGIEDRQLVQRIKGQSFVNTFGRYVLAPSDKASSYYSTYHLFTAIIEAHQKIQTLGEPRGEVIVEHDRPMGPVKRADGAPVEAEQSFRSCVAFVTTPSGHLKISHIYPAGDDQNRDLI